MASNMTAKEKVMHPVAAVKEMMHKGGSHTTDTTGTHTGTHVPGTHTGTHVPGTHTGTGHLSSADKEAGVIARYEVPAGTGVTHTGTHLPGTTHTGTHIPGTTHTGTHIPGTTHTGTHTGLTGTTHHTPLTGSTYTSPTTMGNEEQLMTNEMGLGGTPTMGTTAGTGARPVFSETGHQGVGPHQAKFGVDPASSAAAYEGKEHAGHLPGAGAVGMLGAAASKLMPGHHNKHADTGVAHTGTHGVANYEGGNRMGHQSHHMTAAGLTGAGATGLGAYEAEQHMGHHNRHNDASVLAGTPGLPGTTGTRGEVFTPNDPHPHNVGLNVIGMNTPHNTSDVRSYDNPTAGSVPHTTTGSHVNQDRLDKTSLPANPVMSALTGGKIPPSIHKGYEQAGVYDGAK